MAQLNITLNQEEILQLLSTDHDEAFRILLQNCLNSVLKVESQKQLNAAPYERSETRTDCRNGFRDRDLITRIGTITLSVPRHRNQPFRTLIFDNYSRSEAALIAAMAEMVVNGVSTRKVTRVIETLCGTSVSKSAVSEELSVPYGRCYLLQSPGERPRTLKSNDDCLRDERSRKTGDSGICAIQKRITRHMERIPQKPEEARIVRAHDDHIGCA